MRIKDAQYLLTAVRQSQYPPVNLAEVALVGRSNVGKSSLINCLTNRKSLARISGKPGKTRALNFYLVNGQFLLVDLPGYGFAAVSGKMKLQWAKMIEDYLLYRKQLVGVVHLVDIRHSPTADDMDMAFWLEAHHIPRLTVATKADKISKGKWQKQLNMIKKKLALEKGSLIPFSAVTGAGKEELLDWMASILTDRLN